MRFHPHKLTPLLALTALWVFAFGTARGQISSETKQLIVGIADDWDSSHVTLHHYERGGLAGKKWRRVYSWKGRLGKNGLAWGRGLHRIPAGGKVKREGDGRTPAGVFSLSHGAYGYAKTIKKNPHLPYRQITVGSLWYENTKSPYYNSYRQINRAPQTEAEHKAQMHQGDDAHALKLFIAHNAPPNAIPGYGSAIFFHIWRGGGTKATAGCTTMSEANLKAMISHIDPRKKPLYVILPKAVYQQARGVWQLP